MRTSSDCFACFMEGAARVARRVAPHDDALGERLVRRMAELLARADLDRPPPDLAAEFYPELTDPLGIVDLFADHKDEANARVLELLPGLEQTVRQASDPLRAALGLSLVGNYIDAGVSMEFDWEHALEAEKHAAWGEEAYPVFRERIRPGAQVLIMGDNAGEIGLDTLLVKVLSEMGAEVTYAVRDKPVLNDATLADAELVGMTRLCRVVSSGSDAPGAVLGRLNAETLRLMGRADVLLSKGQGNFESLEGRLNNVFFALKAKCRVVAAALNVEQGASVFVHHE
ncbi:hypothetical protein DPQ33_05195 [Oceanidesulfovibrio indonesiensis]|uniref:Damage-control phosphatase ARMT1-like metal-binding domain-containing protein n=1 Tax=Oceanidesulfovibrio indonesiensis TaxID=54767 RepID=A0A7M3MH86_9BACT|nr:ARMT1-like domain-containing protein [Oceanidesulfovibrio indonesiensis]TVM18856.1 hypothetical protein DPQ33_05195 [Oceanidesulfovibrio indonesiensis]